MSLDSWLIAKILFLLIQGSSVGDVDRNHPSAIDCFVFRRNERPASQKNPMRQSNLIFTTCNWCQIKIDEHDKMNINNKNITDVLCRMRLLRVKEEKKIIYKYWKSFSPSNDFDRRIASSISNAIYWMKATNQCLILSLSNLSRYSSSSSFSFLNEKNYEKGQCVNHSYSWSFTLSLENLFCTKYWLTINWSENNILSSLANVCVLNFVDYKIFQGISCEISEVLIPQNAKFKLIPNHIHTNSIILLNMICELFKI